MPSISFEHNVVVTDPDKIKEIKTAMESRERAFKDIKPDFSDMSDSINAIRDIVVASKEEELLNNIKESSASILANAVIYRYKSSKGDIEVLHEMAKSIDDLYDNYEDLLKLIKKDARRFE